MYYHELPLGNGRILSCDNVRIKFEVAETRRDSFELLFATSSRPDIFSFPQNLQDFKYKYLYQIDYGAGKMTVGYIFNGSERSNMFTGYLDFNPNKIGSYDQFWTDYRHIKSCCDEWSILRVDIALDLPSKREFVYLVKDNRVYTLKAYSHSNKTEYLGLRSNVGFVKLYNKTKESNLDYDLTRLEITCEPSLVSFMTAFPKVYDLSLGQQFGSDILELNATDLAILRLALECNSAGLDPGMMIFNSLARIKKQKLQKFLLPESCLVVCSASSVNSLLTDVQRLYG